MSSSWKRRCLTLQCVEFIRTGKLLPLLRKSCYQNFSTKTWLLSCYQSLFTTKTCLVSCYLNLFGELLPKLGCWVVAKTCAQPKLGWWVVTIRTGGLFPLLRKNCYQNLFLTKTWLVSCYQNLFSAKTWLVSCCQNLFSRYWYDHFPGNSIYTYIQKAEKWRGLFVSPKKLAEKVRKSRRQDFATKGH